jgi:hypothetical protein
LAIDLVRAPIPPWSRVVCLACIARQTNHRAHINDASASLFYHYGRNGVNELKADFRFTLMTCPIELQSS